MAVMTSQQLRWPPLGLRKPRSVSRHSGMVEVFLATGRLWGKGTLSSVMYPLSSQAPADNSKLIVTGLTLIKLRSQNKTERPPQKDLRDWECGREVRMGGRKR